MGYYNIYKGLANFFLFVLLWHFSKECFPLKRQIELAFCLFHFIHMVLHLTCSFKSPTGYVNSGFFKKSYLEQGSLETLQFSLPALSPLLFNESNLFSCIVYQKSCLNLDCFCSTGIRVATES